MSDPTAPDEREYLAHGGRVRLEALRYAVNEEASSYLAIMRTFTGEVSGLLSDQSAAEVAQRLAGQGFALDVDTVDARLSYLVEHGNLARSPRETEARSLREYLQNRARYQLTQRGELVQRHVEELLGHTEAAREVSTEMLGGILDGLVGLGRLDDAAIARADPDVLARDIATLFAQFERLVSSTRDFYTYLAQVLVRYDLDRAEFQAFKTALLDYLQRFVDEVARHMPQLAQALQHVEPRVPALCARANVGQRLLGVEGEAARRAPGLDPADWDGLHAWFVGAPGRDSDAAGVLEAMLPFELLVSPVLTRPALPLDAIPPETGRRERWRAAFAWHSYTVPFNVTGQPVLSVPCGTTPTACRWACRSRGHWVPTPWCSRSAPPSNGPWPDPVDAADLGVLEAAALIAARELSSSELTQACLARIHERDGAHTHAGDPDSLNAWVRVYEEAALTAAARADALLGESAPPTTLWGIPIGLKDLYAVGGTPLTASSRLLDDRPDRDCDVWARLAAHGMILLGHLHTHEFAVGGTTDQVGNPWALERSAGGSSGGSAAALAARMVPAATGTDTAGSLRIPSALCGTSTIKPTRGLVSLRGVVPLAESLDHAGPMARALEDCAPLLAAMAGPDLARPASALAAPAPAVLPARRGGLAPLAGVRLALSPRTAGADARRRRRRRLRRSGRAVPVARRRPGRAASAPLALDAGDDFLEVLYAELLVYHRRFDGRREDYRPSLREWVEQAEARTVSAEGYVAAQTRRRATTSELAHWLAEHRIAALLEPTVPCTAPLRGDGYERAGSDYALISLTHFWDWTGFPVVAIPAGVGTRSALPVGVSLIGAAGSDWDLLDIGIQLQAALGIPEPPPGV